MNEATKTAVTAVRNLLQVLTLSVDIMAERDMADDLHRLAMRLRFPALDAGSAANHAMLEGVTRGPDE